MCVCGVCGVYMYMCVDQKTTLGFSSILPHVGPKDWTQVVKLESNPLYVLSHLAGLLFPCSVRCSPPNTYVKTKRVSSYVHRYPLLQKSQAFRSFKKNNRLQKSKKGGHRCTILQLLLENFTFPEQRFNEAHVVARACNPISHEEAGGSVLSHSQLRSEFNNRLNYTRPCLKYLRFLLCSRNTCRKATSG